MTKYIYAGDELVGQIDGTGTSTVTYYVHTDHLGGTNVLTNASSTESQVLDYYPFGAVRVNDDTDSVGVAIQFIGEYLDNTDLNYLNARYYSPSVGKFTAQDPIARNNPEQVMSDPQQLNMYSYSRNNPLIFIDKSGRKVYLAARTVVGNAMHVYYYVSPESSSRFANIGPFTLGGGPEGPFTTGRLEAKFGVGESNNDSRVGLPSSPNSFVQIAPQIVKQKTTS